MRRIVLALVLLVAVAAVVWGIASAAQSRWLGAGPPLATPTVESAQEDEATGRCPPTGTPVAESASCPSESAGEAYIGPPEKGVVPSGQEPSPEQIERSRRAVEEETYLPGPPLPEGAPPVGPTPGTETEPK